MTPQRSMDFVQLAKSRSMKGRPLSGGCREKTLHNHINVEALIQKGAFNEARQVYGDGCSPGNDSGGRH
jgi:hypothetical protein